MRVLYVIRNRTGLHWKRRLHSALTGQSPFGQDGFFEAAMDAAFDVTRRPAEAVLPDIVRSARSYDALIVNYKMIGGDVKEHEAALKRFGVADLPRILFIGLDKAGRIPGNDVLDRFDLIFKREYFRDLDRYPISDRNKSKFRKTMLGASSRKISWLERYHRSRPPRVAPTYLYDVFFSGSTTSPVRTDVWESVVDSGLSFAGGLQLRKLRTERERKYQAQKLKRQIYLKTMLGSKINLALEGYGEFTFRHLEIWCAGAFMLSTRSLRDLTLPLNAREGVHYVVFEDLPDLRDKLGYYVRNDTERERIAKAGRDMFLRDYDPTRHGEEIRRAILACSA